MFGQPPTLRIAAVVSVCLSEKPVAQVSFLRTKGSSVFWKFLSQTGADGGFKTTWILFSCIGPSLIKTLRRHSDGNMLPTSLAKLQTKGIELMTLLRLPPRNVESSVETPWRQTGSDLNSCKGRSHDHLLIHFHSDDDAVWVQIKNKVFVF